LHKKNRALYSCPLYLLPLLYLLAKRKCPKLRAPGMDDSYSKYDYR